MTNKYFPLEKRKLIMSMYLNGNDHQKEIAQTEMIRGLNNYVKSLLKTKFGAYLVPQKAGSGHFEDLMQISFMAIIAAMPNYDPEISAPTTYFTPYIMSDLTTYITEYFHGNTSHYAEAAKEVRRFIEEYKEDHDRKDPTEYEIMRGTGYGAQTLSNIKSHKIMTNYYYLDDEEKAEVPTVAAGIGNPEKELMETESENFVNEVLSCLDKVERKIIEMRLGLGEYQDEHTQKAIAKSCGLSVAEVRRRIPIILNKLKRSTPEYKKINEKNLRKQFEVDDLQIMPEQYTETIEEMIMSEFEEVEDTYFSK